MRAAFQGAAMGGKSDRFVTRFARDARDYDYTDALSDADWAWEFLRRNKNYAQDVYASRVRFRRPVHYVSGARVYRAIGNQSRATYWGLVCFADPKLRATETGVFWEGERLSYAVDARSSIARQGHSPPDLDLQGSTSCVAVLGANDRQKLLFRFKSVVVDVTLTGPNVLFSPVNLQFRIDGFNDVKRGAKALVLLHDMKTPRPHGAHNSITQRERSYRKRYLIALDCHERGGSLQDTARVFQAFGLTRLEWSTSGNEALKKHVWRCRNKGLELMRDGYRACL